MGSSGSGSTGSGSTGPGSTSGTGAEEVTVAFELAASVISEDAADALVVSVVLSTPGPLAESMSVDVIDSFGGTATSGTDYAAVGTQTVTFDIGASRGTTLEIALGPLDDDGVEGDETSELQLTNPVGPGIVGEQSSHSIVIEDDDVATVEFVLPASITASEDSALDVAVRLDIPGGGQLDVAVMADAIDAGGGTATGAVDYVPFGVQVISFGVGSLGGATQAVTLTPLPDGVPEGNETVNLQVANVTGPSTAALGPQTAHTATIRDDQATVAFQVEDSVSVDEGTPLSVVVMLSTPVPLPGALFVDVVDAMGGTATSSVDYTAFGTQVLVFPIGSTDGMTMNAFLAPLQDDEAEEGETVFLSLQNLVGLGGLGVITSHVVTIADDD